MKDVRQVINYKKVKYKKGDNGKIEIYCECCNELIGEVKISD